MFEGLPLAEGAKVYLDCLPRYEELPDETYMIPDQGNFLLPINPSRYQWYNLISQFRYVSAKTKLNRDFFLSLPGIKSVDFQDCLYFQWRDEHIGFRMADIADSVIDGQMGDYRKVLCFHSTIWGAISAFYFETAFRTYWRYWHALYGCDHSMILCEGDAEIKRDEDEQWANPYYYGQAFSDLVPVPWGFRLEVKEKGHYVIRCLGDSETSGLYDLSAEIKDGRLINNVEMTLLIKNRRACY